MKKYSLKKSVVITLCLYVAAFLALMGALTLIDRTFNSPEEMPNAKYDYIDKTGFDKDIPVVGGTDSEEVIKKPFTDENIKVLKNFYGYKDSEEQQINSLIYYDGTYIQNTAIAYGGVESFDVLAIYDGTVISVREDELLGSIIEIEHGNNVISVYQSVSEVKVNPNDIVKQGDVIAKSGKSNINKSLNSHLLFELIINGRIVNANDYYDKKLTEI